MIQRFADWLVYGVFGMNADTHLGSAVNFFFYDSIKILILLFFISLAMGVVNAYFPIDKLRHYLATRKLYGFQYLFASLFGAITPFCSCSSIPLFIGFVKGGIPLGVTFAFLITSPLVNEVAVAMFLGSFGLRTTEIYVVSGILLGMIGGFVLGRFKLERYLSPWVTTAKRGDLHSKRQIFSFITKEAVAKKVIDEIAPNYADRNGGYTRIIRTGPRRGDAAEMAIIELI